MRATRSHRRHLLVPAVAVVFCVALTGPRSFAASATCSPNGTKLTLTAFDNKFDKNCLAAPANQAFTIDFSNLDRGIPHNVAIYEDETARKNFFRGELTDGPGKQTYSVPGLPAGTWFFRCDPHPEMNGTFVAG
ncbi:MAG TPA: cupredoxin domain-containing protein [Acidimicrobiia bacterium]|jgi:plastocyanin|nr:cupredoxin domain-containing protein [Acidimicrobiia bacterium]